MLKLSPMRRKEALAGYGFILPAIILLLIFGFLPFFIATYTSLYKFPLVNPAKREFLALDNYVRAFQDETLRVAFFNTLYYALWQIPMQTILGLFLAVLVRKPLRGVGIFRTGYYLPVVISMVVASVLWRIMLDSQNGLINSIITQIGFPRQPLLTSTQQALPVLAMMLSWKWVGFSMLIFLAGLNSIPQSLYEAANIDGARGWQSFAFITIPMLQRPALYVIVTNTINAFKLFTPIYVITEGGPQNSTMVMIYYIFREAFRFNRLGYGSAIAVLFTIFLILLAMGQLRMLRSDDD